MLALLTAGILCPTPARTASELVAKPVVNAAEVNSCDGELKLAKKFADLGNWKDAETHFAAAANEGKCQPQALAGIETAKNQEEAIILQAGQIYESEDEWSKAEDLYKAAASNPGIGAATRKVAGERLRLVLQAQARGKSWPDFRDSLTESVKDVAGVTVFFLSLVLLLFTVRSVWKSRQAILIHPFNAPTDELAKGLNIQLRYARATMNNPALSRAAQLPPFLIENLNFADEVEPIEDLEIAGSKIPFSSLGRLFGRPRVRVTGGFDGVGPVANAYSIVQTHNSRADAFIRREIRTGVPNDQRLDLLDFAYDVIVKASTAYADI